MFRQKVSSIIRIFTHPIPSKRGNLLAYESQSRSLAHLEMRMVLAKLFWKYDLQWTNTEEIDWERDTKGYTLWEKPELRCVLQERASMTPSSCCRR